MTVRKRRQPTPGFKLPPPYQPITGEREQLLIPGDSPYCAMMQIAAEDTHSNYVICRGYDTRNKRYYDYVEGDADQVGIAVAKPYGNRFVGLYRIGEIYPAVLPLSSGAERERDVTTGVRTIVPFIGQNPGRVEGSTLRGNPTGQGQSTPVVTALEEEIVHLLDDNDVYINWMLIDGPRYVYFELKDALSQFSGDIVQAYRKIWDPTADGGEGDFKVPACADIIDVADRNKVGHVAGVGGNGSGWMLEREKSPYWVCVINDLCCPGDEQETECVGS